MFIYFITYQNIYTGFLVNVLFSVNKLCNSSESDIYKHLFTQYPEKVYICYHLVIISLF